MPDGQTLGGIAVYALDLPEMCVIHPLVKLYSSCTLRDALQRKKHVNTQRSASLVQPQTKPLWASSSFHAPAIAR